MARRPPQIEVYQDVANRWRWRLMHGNGQVLAASSEGFATKANAKRNFRRMRAVMQQVDEATLKRA